MGNKHYGVAICREWDSSVHGNRERIGKGFCISSVLYGNMYTCGLEILCCIWPVCFAKFHVCLAEILTIQYILWFIGRCRMYLLSPCWFDRGGRYCWRCSLCTTGKRIVVWLFSSLFSCAHFFLPPVVCPDGLVMYSTCDGSETSKWEKGRGVNLNRSEKLKRRRM